MHSAPRPIRTFISSLGFILLIWLRSFSVKASANITNERTENIQALKTYLFQNYDKSIYPMAVDDLETDPTLVQMHFNVLNVAKVSTSDQEMKARVEFRMKWQDKSLKWNPGNFRGVDHLWIRQGDLWLPDIIVENSVSDHVYFGFGDQLMKLDSEGYLWWNPVEMLTTACSVDVTYFPFDAQVCVIRVAASMMTTRELLVKMGEDGEGISTSNTKENGEWKLVKAKCSEDDTRNRFTIDIFIKLRRRRAFYILNLVMPVVFLSLSTCLVFVLPVEAGEKMGMGLTLLVAYAVYLIIAFDHLPTSSLQVSVFIVWLMALLGISSISVVLSVFVLRAYHMNESIPLDKATITTSMFLRKHFLKNEDKQVASGTNPSCPSLVNTGGKNSVAPMEKMHRTPDVLYDEDIVGVKGGQKMTCNNGDKSAIQPRTEFPVENLNWKMVAETWDSFFCRVFLLLVGGSSAVCLGILVAGCLLDAGGVAMPE